MLEDVFEVSPHYRFTTLSMKKAYLKVRQSSHRVLRSVL